ncbi:hypothetical protein ILT44_28690 [Microvirga sp. BT689]|uniref:hypothetical protein n=1 Tax=Microvirga arvi TaxID=2778731 RepID=UPI001951E7F9|nr:hypothetical protein [Microvirga arvi]MBM6584177.1 hypothetical protein [Microvirga arvi]
MNDEAKLHDPGRIVSYLQLPGVPYEAYLQGQKLMASYLARLNRHAGWIASIVWISFVFAASFYVFSTTPSRYAVAFLYVLFVLLIIVLSLWYYQRARLYKNVYRSLENVSCDVFVGENGLLIKSADFSEFFGWSNLALSVKNKDGLFLIMKNIQVVSIPETALKQMPERDALLEFIEGITRSPAATRSG